MDSNDKFNRFSRVAAAIAAAAAIGTWVAVGFLAVWFLSMKPAQAAGFSDVRAYVMPMFQRAETGQLVSGATVVVIQPGYALTAYHAVQRAELGTVKLEIVTGEGTSPLAVAGTAPGFDLALVTSPALKCPCAPLGHDPVQDEMVIAVGFPRVMLIGQQWLTTGLVQNSSETVIKHSAWLTTGNSGGGLFAYQRGQWRLVGVNRAIMITERQEFNNVSYAVPISLVQVFLDAVKELTQ